MIEKQLEDYSNKHKNEVLIVTIGVEEEEQQLIVFRGFTSSLSQSTPFDPENSVLPSNAKVKVIDRVKAPYNPKTPEYIDRGLTWSEFQALMAE